MTRQSRWIQRFAFLLVGLFALMIPVLTTEAAGSDPFAAYVKMTPEIVSGASVYPNDQVQPANCQVANVIFDVYTNVELAGVRIFLTDDSGTYEANTQTLLRNFPEESSRNPNPQYAYVTGVEAIGLTPSHYYSYHLSIIAESGKFEYRSGTFTTPHGFPGHTSNCYVTQSAG